MINVYGPYKRYKQVFGVASHSNPDKDYVVVLTDKGEWQCSCPAWIFHTPRPTCKHIKEAMRYQVLQTFTPKPITPKVEKSLNRFAVIEV